MQKFTLDIHVPTLKKFLATEFEDLTKKPVQTAENPPLKIKHVELPENRRNGDN